MGWIEWQAQQNRLGIRLANKSLHLTKLFATPHAEQTRASHTGN